MAARSSQAMTPSDQKVVLTRVIDAPRSLVFKAWTDPARLAQWWGPSGFTNPVCEMDVRPGGAIRIHMRGPDGTVYPMTGVYREIVAPERLVFISTGLDAEGRPLLEVLNTVTFAEQGGKTTLKLEARVVKATAEAAPYIGGAETGWTQSLERLDKLFVAEKPSGGEIVITRIFDAPRSLVFKAWTEPKHLMAWFHPEGFTVPFCKTDLRIGGTFRFCMRSPEGRDIWGLGVYRELIEPERIVYTDAFSDPEGRPVPPSYYGLSPGHPAETLVTVTFADHEGKTLLTLRHSVLESVAERVATQQGWTEMLDRLAEELSKA